MIVDPDFIEHWKLRTLAELLGQDDVADDMAPLYVLRLWSHCQQRKTDRFEGMSKVALKATCHYKGSAEAFERAMLEVCLIEREGNWLIVHDWRKHNAALFANWENGKRGGRPKGKPQLTEGGSQGLPHGLAVGNPVANPPETHGFPFDNPPPDWVEEGFTHQEPFRLDKSREDEIGGSNTALGASEVGGTVPAPTRAVDLSVALRKHSIQCGPAHPHLIELAALGVTAETMEEAACQAIKSKQGEIPSLGYVVSIVIRWQKERARIASTVPHVEPETPRETVETI